MRDVQMCSRCSERPRLAGARMTWCRECKNAWQRAYRAGVRLQRRVPDAVRDEDGCLIWQGYVTPEGYGMRTLGRQRTYAHRLAWVEKHGPIPPELTVDHLCCKKACLETRHMELVTLSENARRGGAQRRDLSWLQS